MSERTCSVCQMPLEPGEAACSNCGAPQAGGARRPQIPGLPRKKGGLPLAVLVAGVLVFGVAGFVVTVLQEKVSPVAEQIEKPAPTPSQARSAEPDVTVPRPAEPAQAEPEPTAEPEPAIPTGDAEELPPAESPPEPIVLQFPARVVASKGNRVKNGAPCVIQVHTYGGRIADLDVTCAKDTIYDTRSRLNGISRMGGQIREQAGKAADEWRYRLQFSDTGARSLRSQVTLNSLTRTGSVFSESTDAFRVELRLSEFSLPRQGEPVFDTPREVLPLRTSLDVISTQGQAPTLPKTCSLDVRYLESTRQGPNCKTELRCGSRLLYGKGQSGFGPCDIEEGKIVRFRDDEETHEDGDPKFDFDTTSGSVHIEDSPNHQSYSIELRIPD